jgi:hypothetical protein
MGALFSLFGIISAKSGGASWFINYGYLIFAMKRGQGYNAPSATQCAKPR